MYYIIITIRSSIKTWYIIRIFFSKNNFIKSQFSQRYKTKSPLSLSYITWQNCVISCYIYIISEVICVCMSMVYTDIECWTLMIFYYMLNFLNLSFYISRRFWKANSNLWYNLQLKAQSRSFSIYIHAHVCIGIYMSIL